MKKFGIGVFVASAIIAMPASAMQKKNADGTPSINPGELVFYEMPNYNGESYMVKKTRPLLELEWNVASIAVHPGDSWQICQKPRYQGTCITFTEGATNLGRVPIKSARPSSEVK